MRTIINLRSFLMKKTVFALFAVMLVLSLATCDLLDPPEAARRLTEDGMVSLIINVAGGGIGRALTTSNAQGAVNYYEVVFKSGSNYYQIEFAPGATATDRTISIPAGTYSTAADAVMFAGNKVGTDYTLLAVGIITATNAGAGATITGSTTGVTFTLSALKATIGGTGSAFKITGPNPANVTNFDYRTITVGSSTTKVGGTYPVFPIPPAGYANTDATFTAAGNIVGQYSITLPNNTGVFLQANWSATSAGYAADTPNVGTTVGITEDTASHTIGTALGNPCVFTFLVNVTGGGIVDGLCAVSIEAPVYPLSSTARLAATNANGATNVWHIRGGTSAANNALIDSGGNANGAFLLGIGKYFDAEVIITDPGIGDWNP
jgi:hypothetical protein